MNKYLELKQRVFDANQRLHNAGLAPLTWGNASEFDKELGVIAIKPSGVAYETMKVDDIVIVDLNGNIVEGDLRPSSDLPTHLYLYKHFPNIGGVVHTHSSAATSFAQAGTSINAYGTTHADTFYGDVPCTRPLTQEEIESEYELNTGKVIVETFANIDYEAIPAVVVKNHGPFTWGKNAEKAVENSIILEEVSKMAINTIIINRNVERVDQYLLDKHYKRKHGKKAYYGQKK